MLYHNISRQSLSKMAANASSHIQFDVSHYQSSITVIVNHNDNNENVKLYSLSYHHHHISITCSHTHTYQVQQVETVCCNTL